MCPLPLYDAQLLAKREVSFLANAGRMLTPREAWLLTGQKIEADTLWSVAYRQAVAHDVSPEDVHVYLEKQFPRFSMSGGHSHHWDDHHHHHHRH